MLGSLSSSQQQALMANYLGLVNSDFSDPSWSDSEYFDFIDFTYSQGCTFYENLSTGYILESFLNDEFGYLGINITEGLSIFGNQANYSDAITLNYIDISNIATTSLNSNEVFNCDPSNVVTDDDTNLTVSILRASVQIPLPLDFEAEFTTKLVDNNTLNPFECHGLETRISGFTALLNWEQNQNPSLLICEEIYDVGRILYRGQLQIGVKFGPGSNFLTFEYTKSGAVGVNKFDGKGQFLTWD